MGYIRRESAIPTFFFGILIFIIPLIVGIIEGILWLAIVAGIICLAFIAALVSLYLARPQMQSDKKKVHYRKTKT